MENIMHSNAYFHSNFTMRKKIGVPPDCKDFSGLPPGSATLVALLAEFFSILRRGQANQEINTSMYRYCIVATVQNQGLPGNSNTL